MVTVRKESWPKQLPRLTTPISYLTENGFTILRLCELDTSVTNSPSDCGFLVQRDGAYERAVYVSFDPRLVAGLRLRRRVPLSDGSTFWLVCAESCLANYLWEHDNVPPDGRLVIDSFAPDEFMLAVHWQDSE